MSEKEEVTIPLKPAAIIAEESKNRITAEVAAALNVLPAFVILPFLQNLTAEVAAMQKKELETANKDYAEALKAAEEKQAEAAKSKTESEAKK